MSVQQVNLPWDYWVNGDYPPKLNGNTLLVLEHPVAGGLGTRMLNWMNTVGMLEIPVAQPVKWASKNQIRGDCTT